MIFATASSYSLQADVKALAVQLIHYYTICFVNFKFGTFYDKNFVDASKTLIKDKVQLDEFLEMIGLSYKEFFEFLIYISYPIFTSYLVKFIKSTYLSDEHNTIS